MFAVVFYCMFDMIIPSTFFRENPHLSVCVLQIRLTHAGALIPAIGVTGVRDPNKAWRTLCKSTFKAML